MPENTSTSNPDFPLSRRDLLALPGATAFLSAWLDGSLNAAPPEPKFFPPEDFHALQAFTEILIPTDDTPGARQAQCAHFIDFVLQASPAQTQQQWRDAMATLRQAGFHAAGAQGREAIVRSMSQSDHPVFRLIKQQNTFAFYTSRAGMIETLDYKGNTYNATFPACTHPEHHRV